MRSKIRLNYFFIFFLPACLVTTLREKIRETDNQFGLAIGKPTSPSKQEKRVCEREPVCVCGGG